MRSERRHDLQRNDLLDWLNESFGFITPYKNILLAGLAVVVLGLLAWQVLSQSSSKKAGRGWDALFAAMDRGQADQLDGVVERFGDTDVATWANLAAADLYLRAGCDELFNNEATAAQELKKAENNYLNVLEAGSDPDVRERATFGLARAYETMAATPPERGLDDAKKRYQEVVDNWPDGAFAVRAARRLADLERGATKDFYDKLAKYDPKPAAIDPAGGGLDMSSFGMDGLSPGEPPKDFSNLLGPPGDSSPDDDAETMEETPAPEAAPASPDGEQAAPPPEAAPSETPAPVSP
jgi:hypothetical protein